MLINQASNVGQTGEQSYRHLFKHWPICILVADLTATPVIILEINRRTEVVYGYTADELIGSPAACLIAEESWLNVQNIFQQVMRGETVETEVSSRHRDGTTFPTRVIATLDPASSGHMFIAIRDITAERQRRSEEEAIDAERLRIAHEIHDGVAQNLAGLRFKLALWMHVVEGVPPEMSLAFNEVQAVLITAITDIRRAIFALRPLDLETLGFLPALSRFVNNFGDQNQLSARLEVSGHPNSLPINYELPLLRVIQESLNNINQHADASSVLVQLMVDISGSVAATIRDNGRGFDPNLVDMIKHSEHFGLRHMRERIQDLGGTFDIYSAVGHGTKLWINLPPPSDGFNHGFD